MEILGLKLLFCLLLCYWKTIAWTNAPDRRLQLYSYNNGILTPTNNIKPQRLVFDCKLTNQSTSVNTSKISSTSNFHQFIRFLSTNWRYNGWNNVYKAKNGEKRDWCAKWGDYCVPESKLRFATCCSGTRCICGSLWKTGRCQCKTESLFG